MAMATNGLAVIRRVFGPANAEPGPALFLDRDGVLNRRDPHGYILRTEDLVLLPTALGAAHVAQDRGARIVVVSNQGAIARGLAPVAAVDTVNAALLSALALRGVHVDAIYLCPHHPAAQNPRDRQCRCRKPQPGLVVDAARELGLDLARSVMIGDQPSDMAAAAAAGIPPLGRILVSEDDDPQRVASRAVAAFGVETPTT